MICDICKKKKAVIHIEKHAGTNHTHLNICASCAGIEGLDPEKLKGEDLNRIISDIATFNKPKSDLVCEECGTTSNDFEKSRRLGCASCYTNLSEVVDLRDWQLAKNLKHIGKTPFKLLIQTADFCENAEDLQMVEDELAKSIASENYEKAAKLRDKIVELKKALA